MEFFEQYKKKLISQNIFLSVLFVLVSAGFLVGTICFASDDGFSLKTDYAVGVRGTRSGIPVPNVVLLLLLMAMTALMIYCAINAVRNVIKNPVYNKFIANVEKMAPVQLVGEQLSAMPKNKLAKGDLRFDDKYFFYAAGDAMHLLWTHDIVQIRPVCQQGKYENYYVYINTKAEQIRLMTTKKHYMELAQAIHKSVQDAQKAAF